MDRAVRVLLVEDSEDDAALLVRELQRGGYRPTFQRVDTAEAMSAALDAEHWDLVIADYAMPRFSALAALVLLKNREMDLPFIIVSGTIGEETAVAAMKAGAHDYVMKGNTARLTAVIDRELREATGRRQRKQAEETIKYLAYYDSLTDLPNRVLLHERLQEAIIGLQGSNGRLALLVMDLDRFKDVNDSLGHHAGDLLLQQVATELRATLRVTDTVARLGGDEFAIVLPGADVAAATIVADIVLRALQKPLVIEGQHIEVAASIGVALCPDHGEDPPTLLRRADVALYVAKGNGVGYAVYAPDQDQHSATRLALVGELRHAVENEELVLHYQPKMSLTTGRVTSVEALVRWQHPRQGLIPPLEFIPLAERTGLIWPVTRWVMHEALRQVYAWAEAGVEVSVAVNVSMRTLQDPTLPDVIAEVLAERHVVAQKLNLEVTESALMANPPRAIEVLTRLRSLGVRLAIDDFGTGYSSLSYLRRLPVHEIKIDKSFVTNLAGDGSDLAIVRSTIDLGHNLGLEVVAEGVEDWKTYELLAELGCDAAQGYYISRPVPAEELPQRFFLEGGTHSPHSAEPCKPVAESLGDSPLAAPKLLRPARPPMPPPLRREPACER